MQPGKETHVQERHNGDSFVVIPTGKYFTFVFIVDPTKNDNGRRDATTVIKCRGRNWNNLTGIFCCLDTKMSGISKLNTELIIEECDTGPGDAKKRLSSSNKKLLLLKMFLGDV